MNIRKPTAIVCCALLGLCSCGKGERERQIQLENPPNNVAFVIESGPDTIGRAQMFVIKHKETGQRFVFTKDTGSGRIFLMPLTSSEQ